MSDETHNAQGDYSKPAWRKLTVSVALCTYNGAKFVREQLDSISGQSRKPDEVVVGDDASTDETIAIVESWAADSGIPTRITRNPIGLGTTRNFEETMSRCTGDVICPCDQDDAWLPDKLSLTIGKLEARPVGLFCLCGSEICDQELRPTGATVFSEQRFEGYTSFVQSGVGFRAFIRHLVAPGHAIAVRREVLSVAKPFPDTCLYDQWLALVASSLGQTELVSNNLVRYRYHAGQVTGGVQKSLADWANAQATLKLDHLHRNLQTFRTLRERVGSRISDENRRLLDGKIEFLEQRMRMREGRLRRTQVSLRLLANGSYNRFGRGWLTFLRDLKG